MNSCDVALDKDAEVPGDCMLLMINGDKDLLTSSTDKFLLHWRH